MLEIVKQHFGEIIVMISSLGMLLIREIYTNIRANKNLRVEESRENFRRVEVKCEAIREVIAEILYLGKRNYNLSRKTFVLEYDDLSKLEKNMRDLDNHQAEFDRVIAKGILVCPGEIQDLLIDYKASASNKDHFEKFIDNEVQLIFRTRRFLDVELYSIKKR